MSKGVLDIHISGYTLAKADKLSIPEMLSFIQSLRQSMDANEFEIAAPVVSHLESMLLYLSKIGPRTLPLFTAWGGLPASSS